MQNISNHTLQQLFQNSLSLIRKHLFNNANLVNDNNSLVFKTSKPMARTIIIESSQNIIELDAISIVTNFPDMKDKIQGLKGFYDSGSGKIILNKNRWCIKTVIHETLHACSLQQTIPNLSERYRNFFEGLTEFYTGYVLSREYPNSYNNCWRILNDRQCQLTYDFVIKIWNAFFNFIPISRTFPIYFFNGSSNWNELTTSFINDIKVNFPNFQNIFYLTNKKPMHENLLNECRMTFNKGRIDSIQNSRNLFTSYENIII